MTDRTIREFCRKEEITKEDFKESLEYLRVVAHIQMDEYSNGTVEGVMNLARAIIYLTDRLEKHISIQREDHTLID